MWKIYYLNPRYEIKGLKKNQLIPDIDIKTILGTTKLKLQKETKEQVEKISLLLGKDKIISAYNNEQLQLIKKLKKEGKRK